MAAMANSNLAPFNAKGGEGHPMSAVDKAALKRRDHAKTTLPEQAARPCVNEDVRQQLGDCGGGVDVAWNPQEEHGWNRWKQEEVSVSVQQTFGYVFQVKNCSIDIDAAPPPLGGQLTRAKSCPPVLCTVLFQVSAQRGPQIAAAAAPQPRSPGPTKQKLYTAEAAERHVRARGFTDDELEVLRLRVIVAAVMLSKTVPGLKTHIHMVLLAARSAVLNLPRHCDRSFKMAYGSSYDFLLAFHICRLAGLEPTSSGDPNTKILVSLAGIVAKGPEEAERRALEAARSLGAVPEAPTVSALQPVTQENLQKEIAVFLTKLGKEDAKDTAEWDWLFGGATSSDAFVKYLMWIYCEKTGVPSDASTHMACNAVVKTFLEQKLLGYHEENGHASAKRKLVVPGSRSDDEILKREASEYYSDDEKDKVRKLVYNMWIANGMDKHCSLFLQKVRNELERTSLLKESRGLAGRAIKVQHILGFHSPQELSTFLMQECPKVGHCQPDATLNPTAAQPAADVRRSSGRHARRSAHARSKR